LNEDKVVEKTVDSVMCDRTCASCGKVFKFSELSLFDGMYACQDCIFQKLIKTKTVILQENTVVPYKKTVPYKKVAHYELLPGVESIDVIDIVANRPMIKDNNLSFEVGNILKYGHRIGLKDDITKELEKLIHYAQMCINKINVKK
jgi:DNA-directed RNA polymerase subunit RPC12/RpoP